jgi:uncharacterized protein (DUF1800 family)
MNLDQINLESLKYPIGKFSVPEKIDNKERNTFINTLAEFPERLSAVLQDLKETDLNRTYRRGSWAIKQVVHHCADSHIKSVSRFRWALTENQPMIKAYNENLWAQMSDYQAPIEDSIYLIKGLHARWVFMLKNMEPSDYQKTFVHPETMRTITLESNLALYAWHCDHHLAHIHLALGR